MSRNKLRFKDGNGNDYPEWVEVKVKDFGIIITGSTPPKANKLNWDSEDYIWVSPADMGVTKYITNTNNKVSKQAHSKQRVLHSGDVLVTCIGSIGKMGIIAGEGSTNQQINSIKVNSNYNNEYIYYVILNDINKIRNVSASTAVPIINKSSFEDIGFYASVSLEEQQKIACLFSKLDERIELREQKIARLKEYKKGLQQAVFGNNGERTLRFKDDNGNDYPDWVQSKVGEIFEVSRGVVIAKTAISPNVNGSHKYPVYSSQTLNYGVMGYRDKFAYEGKRITWTTDGANAGTVSLRDGKFSCTNVCGVLSEKNSHIGFVNKCNAIIIGLLAPKFVSYVGNPKLMSNVMSEIVIKVPVSIEEQEKIANLFSKIDNQIELEEQLLQAAKDEKQGLMQRVF